MDLRNGEITIGELLQNQDAVQILNQEFPGILNNPMMRAAHGMQLRQVIDHIKKRVPQEKISRLLRRLREL